MKSDEVKTMFCEFDGVSSLKANACIINASQSMVYHFADVSKMMQRVLKSRYILLSKSHLFGDKVGEI